MKIDDLLIDKKEYDTPSDELDWNSLNERGDAILKRRYIKDGKYLTLLNESSIVVEGITAFLYSDSYGGELQLLPLNFCGAKENLEVDKYFQQYFAIRKKFYLQKEKSKPNSTQKNLEKEFILNHIKQEKRFYSKYKDYFKSIKENKEKTEKKMFVKSYLKWIENKRNPLKLLNYVELILLISLCLIIIGLIILELFFTNKEWNIIQNINKLFQQSDELQRQIVIFLVLAFIASFLYSFTRIKKILKEHKI